MRNVNELVTDQELLEKKRMKKNKTTPQESEYFILHRFQTLQRQFSKKVWGWIQ